MTRTAPARRRTTARTASPRSVLVTGAKVVVAGVAVLGVTLLIGLLLVHVLTYGSVGHLDDAIERSLAGHRTSTLNTLTYAGTQLAQRHTVEVALAALVVVLALVTRRIRPPLFLAVTVIGESAIYFAASTLVPRDRPHVPRLGIGDPHASFPSGHVAAAIAFYGGCAVLAAHTASPRLLRAITVVIAVVVPPLVGFCRMYRGFHHLSDILVGALLGGTWLLITTRLLLLRQVDRP